VDSSSSNNVGLSGMAVKVGDTATKRSKISLRHSKREQTLFSFGKRGFRDDPIHLGLLPPTFLLGARPIRKAEP
jgi:hypothetical protein